MKKGSEHTLRRCSTDASRKRTETDKVGSVSQRRELVGNYNRTGECVCLCVCGKEFKEIKNGNLDLDRERD